MDRHFDWLRDQVDRTTTTTDNKHTSLTFLGVAGAEDVPVQLQHPPHVGRSGDLGRTDIERFLHLLIVSEVLVEEVKIGLHDRVYNYVRIGPEAEKVTTTGTIVVSD